MTLPSSFSDLTMFLEPGHLALGKDLEQKLKGARFTSENVGAELGRLGLFGLVLPAELGGGGVGTAASQKSVDVRALCIAREALGYISPMADAVFAVQGLGAHPMVLAKGSAGRRELFSEVARGSKVLAFALTEPEAGSDVASLRATARQEDSGWILDGEKVFISNAGIADHYVVFANAITRGSGRPGPTDIRTTSLETPRAKRTISAFLMPARAPGLTVEPMATIGDHPLGRLMMKGCTLEPGALVGEPGEGLSLALGTLEVFRTTVGAAAVGMARRAIDESIRRVKERVQFGKRLAEMQLTQAALAEMLTELDAARLLVFRAAWLKDRGERARAEVAMAKLFATEAAQRIVDRAVQLHGGLGVLRGSPVETLYREVRALRIYEGTSEIQKLIIGSSLVANEPGMTTGRRA